MSARLKKSVTLIQWGYDGQLEKYVGGKQNYWLLKGFLLLISVLQPGSTKESPRKHSQSMSVQRFRFSSSLYFFKETILLNIFYFQDEKAHLNYMWSEYE